MLSNIPLFTYYFLLKVYNDILSLSSIFEVHVFLVDERLIELKKNYEKFIFKKNVIFYSANLIQILKALATT